jgi:hypothetical protein
MSKDNPQHLPPCSIKGCIDYNVPLPEGIRGGKRRGIVRAEHPEDEAERDMSLFQPGPARIERHWNRWVTLLTSAARRRFRKLGASKKCENRDGQQEIVPRQN